MKFLTREKENLTLEQVQAEFPQKDNLAIIEGMVKDGLIIFDGREMRIE